jgi:hypothetical protein
LPTLAFWNRRDVRRITGPWLAVFAFVWLLALELLRSTLHPWASALMALSGPLLFLGMLERYLRARLRRRALGQEPLALPRVGRGDDRNTDASSPPSVVPHASPAGTSDDAGSPSGSRVGE